MTSSCFNMAEQRLLDASELTRSDLFSALETISTRQVHYADLYFQSAHAETWVLEQGIVKDASYDIEHGVGVRAISGEKTGFAYSDEISKAALHRAVLAARSIVKQGSQQSICMPKQTTGLNLYPSVSPLNMLSEKEKVQLLKEIDQVARAEDSRVSEVMVSLSGVHETILIFSSDGTYAADIRPLVRLNISVIATQKGRFEGGFSGGGGRGFYTTFFTEGKGAIYAKEAVRQALVNLEAVSSPAGKMPVILGAGWPGVLLHEAVGHGLEADFNRKGTSVFTGKIGESVASPLCTIVDNGALPGRRGSLNIDDEGVPTQETVLIEKGILKGYMQDKLNARLMKMKPTGNARRESYACLPLPRMTNTYMRAGEHTPEEMIASTDRGLYVVNLAGGQVDITSGKFVFSTSEAYLIEKGKITVPVKGVTLIGSGTEVLHKVLMVGDDLELDHGVGICGKEGQSIPVGVGQPTLKIEELTVGGTEL